jgi:hypothetical protein
MAAAAAGLMLCCLLHMSYFHLHKISRRNLNTKKSPSRKGITNPLIQQKHHLPRRHRERERKRERFRSLKTMPRKTCS